MITDKKEASLRKEVLKYAEDKYGTVPESMWAKYPEDVVLRHKDNRKWYALIMSVRKNKLGLSGTEAVDILNIKCDPLMLGSLLMQEGFLPCYHMNKNNWITALLDGSADKEQLFMLIDLSYKMTSSAKKVGFSSEK